MNLARHPISVLSSIHRSIFILVTLVPLAAIISLVLLFFIIVNTLVPCIYNCFAFICITESCITAPKGSVNLDIQHEKYSAWKIFSMNDVDFLQHKVYSYKCKGRLLDLCVLIRQNWLKARIPLRIVVLLLGEAFQYICSKIEPVVYMDVVAFLYGRCRTQDCFTTWMLLIFLLF